MENWTKINWKHWTYISTLSVKGQNGVHSLTTFAGGVSPWSSDIFFPDTDCKKTYMYGNLSQLWWGFVHVNPIRSRALSPDYPWKSRQNGCLIRKTKRSENNSKLFCLPFIFSKWNFSKSLLLFWHLAFGLAGHFVLSNSN